MFRTSRLSRLVLVLRLFRTLSPVDSCLAWLMDEHRAYGPRLQVAMFDAAQAPPEGEVVAFADRARVAF